MMTEDRISLDRAKTMADAAVAAGLATHDDAGGGTYAMGPELAAIRKGFGGAPTFAGMTTEEASAVEAAILA